MDGEACRIELLGILRATGADGRSVTRFRTAKTAALLAFLAFYGSHPHPRETLCEMFWPDAHEADARNSLSKALGSLRNQLEPPGVPQGAVLVADRANVGLNRPLCVVDTALWEAALSRARRADREGTSDTLSLYQSALTLYTGELLPGVYDDWCLRERERLLGEFVDAARRAAVLAEAAGDRDTALDCVRRAIAADPLREAAHALLVGLLVRGGDAPAAAHAFDALQRVLRDELGVEPSAETRALLGEKVSLPSLLSKSNVSKPGSSSLVPIPASEVTQQVVVSPAALRQDDPTERWRDVGGALPLTLTRFFGREEELNRLAAWLAPIGGEQSARLVTVTGPGGTGKTRLATEAARRAAQNQGDGMARPVWWASLAEATDAPRLMECLLTAAGVPRGQKGDGDPITQITGVLTQGGPGLLVLDNFEQLLDANRPADADAAVRVVEQVLSRAPACTCLITSRQRLGIPGEREFFLSPLPAPPAEEEPSAPAVLLQNACIALFVDRAQLVRPDFQITEANAADITALCDKLEGLPLAIELAAARAQVLSPRDMGRQLSSRFGLLASRARGIVRRHQTLQNAIQWSYDLLAPELAAFLEQLSCFRGGWTLDAAEAVTGEPLVLDALAQLVECSLVLSGESGGDGLRFRQLESLREFADLRLSDAARQEIGARHAAYFCQFAEQAEEYLTGPCQREWLPRLEADHDNCRAALAFCARTGDLETGLRLAGALGRFWYVRGFAGEGLASLSELLTGPGADAVPGPVRAKAGLAAGALARLRSENERARPFLLQAAALFAEAGDVVGRAGALSELGFVAFGANDYEQARALFTEARAVQAAQGSAWGLSASLNGLAIVCCSEGGMDTGRALFEEALALRRVTGDPQAIATSLLNLGNVALLESDDARARPLLEESLALCRALGDTWGVAAQSNSLGVVALRQGDWDAARAFCAEARALFERMGDRSGAGMALMNSGNVALAEANVSQAHAYFADALRAQRETGDRSGLCFSLDGMARAEARSGLPLRAAYLWGAVEAMRRTLHLPLPPANVAPYEAAVHAARAASIPAEFDAAWDEGRAVSAEAAAALALSFPADK